MSDLFDFLISMGVGVNSYICDLEEFGKRFVDSKQRQMRFATFGVPNKIGVAYPWMKIAILKKAYKKPAKQNLCSNPEVWWTNVPKAPMDSAEQLLRYVHATAVAAGWAHSTKTKWLGNVDIAIAESFADIATAHKSKPPVEKVREALLNGLAKMKGFNATVFNCSTRWFQLDQFPERSRSKCGCRIADRSCG